MPQQQFTKELENVYDNTRKSARFFDKKTPIELFRGIKKGSSDGLMQPTLIGFHLKRGPRKPDVLFHDSKGITPQYEGSDINRALILDDSGELTRHILANAGDYVVQGCRTLKGDHRGMSLFDKKNPRLSFKWCCIPAVD